MTCKDHSVSAYLRVECKSLEARRVAAGVTATLQFCSYLQPLGLRLGAWPAPVCISVAARHVRAPHPLGDNCSIACNCNHRVYDFMNSANFDTQES